MVVHDREAQKRWSEQRVMRETRKEKSASRSRRWSVVGLQSLACVAIVLLVFMFKLAGGSAYERLKQSFWGALEQNRLMAVFSDLWGEEKTAESSEDDGVKEDDFTSEKNWEKAEAEPSVTAAPSEE